MTEKESAADRAIREAMESVERLEREKKGAAKGVDATDAEADSVEILEPGAGPPSANDDGAEKPAEAPKPAAKKSASDALLEATMKAKQELTEVLAQTQKEAKDMFDRLARVSADFDNYKKRQTREKDDAIKFGNEKVFKELLPVLDNLLRAIGTAGGETGAFVDGVKLVAKQFEDALAKFGVTGFDSQGKPFDPNKHEAVGGRADAKVPAQHVCEEYQRGYMLHDRLLRPALVIVSTGPGEN
jgi:molecular chaperone GrpE